MALKGTLASLPITLQLTNHVMLLLRSQRITYAIKIATSNSLYIFLKKRISRSHLEEIFKYSLDSFRMSADASRKIQLF